jgi:Tol biopolymer transport system component
LRFSRVTVQPLVGPARPYALESTSSPVLAGPYWENTGTLVFSSTVPTSDLELLTSAPDGTSVRKLTADRVDEFQPVWSPNGHWIAYGRGRLVKETDRIAQSSLFLMDSTGGHVRRLTRGAVDDGPSWAPDGKRLVFLRGNGLFVLDLAHGRTRPLHVTADSAPSWSPDGTAIAFGIGTRLEVVRQDGAHRRVLFDGGNDGVPAQIGRPAWSSDGHRLAADVFYDHGNWTHDRKVIVARSGGELAPVGCIPGQPPYQPEGYGLTGIAWSPDDRSVVLDGLVVCRVDGTGGHWLHPGAEPDWQRRPR